MNVVKLVVIVFKIVWEECVMLFVMVVVLHVVKVCQTVVKVFANPVLIQDAVKL